MLDAAHPLHITAINNATESTETFKKRTAKSGRMFSNWAH